MFYAMLRRLLFAMNAEASHDVALTALACASRSKVATALIKKCNRCHELPRRVMGINFPNPVGLAAGLDKHARACNALHALGFGWIEVGAVTPRPQPGNPKPRMFRIHEHRAIINRMGMNSAGADAMKKNLARVMPGVVIGVNIGKNAATRMADAPGDYAACMDALHAHADYIALNISSPNTPGLRDLQFDDALDALLNTVNRKRMQLADADGRRMPLVLKVAPDLEEDAIAAMAALARKHGIDGIAATNTTVTRPGVGGAKHAHEVGGMSGAPICELATDAVRRWKQNLQGEIAIIGVGGIDSADDALEKFHAGADLIQLYTGFIYRGPKLIKDILARLHTMRAA